MKKSNIVLLALLCLLVAAGVLLVFRMENNDAPPADDPAQGGTAAPEVTATAEPTASATPEPTATAAPSPTATATPAPTAEPTATPTPTPARMVDTSGTFRTDTGNWLNLVVKWELTGSGDDLSLQLDAYAESYSLTTNKRVDDVMFTVNGSSTYVSSGPIEVDSPAALVETLLGSATMDAGSGQEARVSVTWNFSGSYGGEDVGSLTASATIPLA